MSERKLNKAQKEAVEHNDGPLLIVAGAGTGKTTVITTKIAFLIEKGLAKPEEILALTFTDKAAEEMQIRLDETIDIGYTDIQISTFHAFCQAILEKHAIDIGLSNSFKLVTETAAWLLIRQNFSKFNLDYYRPMGNPTKHIHELLKHFSKCKDELIAPEDYLKYGEGLTDETPENEAEKKRFAELSSAYHTYNQLLIDNAMLDFGDLIFYTHKLFSTRPAILEKLKKQYKYILVDEFQDVNYSQYELVKMLSDDNSCLTVVGDDDQSIYAFRGASVSNIMRFKDDFPKAREVVLNENYRSNQAILDLAYESIQNNNPDRLEIKLKLDKRLVSKAAKQNNETAIVHLHEATLDEEVQGVVREIARLKQIDETSTWDDFAILVRANNHAEPFLTELQRQAIPYEFLSSSGLYRLPVIVDCLNFLKIMVDHKESSAIYRLLCLEFLKVRVNDLHTITFMGKKKSLPYYAVIKNPEEYGVSQEGSATCRQLLSALENGMRNSKTKKPYQLIVNFLEEIGYFKYLIEGEKNGNEAAIKKIYHLTEFLKYIKEYETISPDANVANFLDHFMSVGESGDKGSLYQPSDTPDSVNVMTVHGSKGLEFKYVFVVNCVEERFPSRAKSLGIEIPVDLVKEQLPEGDGHYQEERRLFYVAVTRAKERLYFSSASSYGGTRAKKISRFLAELKFAANAKEAVKKIAVPEVLVEKDEATGEFAYTLPKAFSFSQLRSYETCPYQYKLAHILHIPTKGSASFSFGQTMHATLQNFYIRIQELNSAKQVSLFDAPVKSSNTATAVATGIKVPTLDELLKIYEASWLPDWYKSEHQREEYYDKGKDILRIFYKSHEGNWTIPVNLESWFKIKVGKYLVHGRIDRIDQLPDGSLEIIDYKTGKAKDKLTTDDKEQLLIYQIATQELPEYHHIGKPSKLTFYYVNDNLQNSFIGEDKELEKLREKLVGTIDKIHSKDFTATPSQFACEYCDFKDICDYRV